MSCLQYQNKMRVYSISRKREQMMETTYKGISRIDQGACDCVFSQCLVDSRRSCAARWGLVEVFSVDKRKRCNSFRSLLQLNYLYLQCSRRRMWRSGNIISAHCSGVGRIDLDAGSRK